MSNFLKLITKVLSYVPVIQYLVEFLQRAESANKDESKK